MATAALQDRFRDHPTLGFVDWVLRGIGQVVFQNNPISGAVILIRHLLQLLDLRNSLPVWDHHQYADRPSVQSRQGDDQGWPVRIQWRAGRHRISCLYEPELHNRKYSQSPSLPLHCALRSLFQVIVPAFGAILGPHKVPGLTMPFVLATWFFLGALLQFAPLMYPTPSSRPRPQTLPVRRPAYTWVTWFHGITMGIAEIFFQDNWVTGVIILIGIAINTRIGALMALMGSTLAVGAAVLYGAHDEAIRDGLFGYNAALTAMALGGFFLVLNVQALSIR